MKRKRIGVIAAQIDENTQNLFMQGFLEEAFRLNYDVCTFSMYLRYDGTILREHGDANIYKLIENYDFFDAFVILADTIQAPGLLNTLEDQLHSYFSGPVLVVDKESSFFPSVMINHYPPFRKLIDHLIEDHHYQDIIFLNGTEEHKHSIERLQAYQDSLAAHDIPIQPNNIFYGNYWYNSGDSFAQNLLRTKRKLPDAIACANDCMAIGVCTTLTKHGIRVPEDVAVIGYDSIEEGRIGNVPLTSAPAPSKECGIYSAQWIHASMQNLPLPDLNRYTTADNKSYENHKDTTSLFIGRSCGCTHPTILQQQQNEKLQSTSAFTVGFFSYLNTMMEELISQTTYADFFNTVFQYIYQIRDFDSFHLCLNNNWDVSKTTETEVMHQGYTNTISRIIRCGKDSVHNNSISFHDTFDRDCLLPELEEGSDKPCSYIFTPLYFNDHSLGYAVISYGNEPKVYDKIYHLWLRNVMQGLECFNRQYALTSLIKHMESTQIRDSLTGLYNMRGFLTQATDLCEAAMFEGHDVLIVAIDIGGLHTINANFGRKEGDRAILSLSEIVSDCTKSDELCARMCNDEFLIISHIKDSNRERLAEIETFITQRAQQLNQLHTIDYTFHFCFGHKQMMISNTEVLEQTINDAVAEKNARKVVLQKQFELEESLTEEELANDKLVTTILNDNLFLYHFQPIVNAHSGEIYSYEALMRTNTTEKISPLVVLESAERLNRLYDIEKATFHNVLDYIEQHPEHFTQHKVFINSIPAHQLDETDRKALLPLLNKHSNTLVVEFTESSELDDTQLEHIKKQFEQLNIETAVDDYGSGYSNTNNLLRYMPRYIKIDRMLITEIDSDPKKQYLVKTIIDFAHDNDILVLAEGVENSTELKEVIRLGIDLIQGYYTAKPQATPIQQIDTRIINEIIQYNQSFHATNRREYTAKSRDRISLPQLAIGRFTHIVIPGDLPCNETLEIIGSVGFHPNISILVKEGFHGTIFLDSVSLGSDKGNPCIILEDNVSLTIDLIQDNELRTGGILVPESSSLTFTGLGNLSVTANGGHHFAIGNDIDARHGDLIFNQDGGIFIYTSGMQGIGIGSGLGGCIDIKRGLYHINMNGQESVAIGSFYGNDPLSVCLCDLEIHFMVAKGVLIGSVYGQNDIRVANLSAKFWVGSSDVVAIGTLSDKVANIDIYNGNLTFNMRSMKCIAIGGNTGETNIHLETASFKIALQGKTNYAFGNYSKNAKLACSNCDITTNINSGFETDIGAQEEDIIISNSRCVFFLNGNPIEHNVLQKDFHVL
ncbi:MAG: EAL domain-containing protein [Eubacteriales bacterium]|nr:EAL domain-containing protein [Eubacteriales bacterium]